MNTSQHHSTEPPDLETILAVLGQADAALLAALADVSDLDKLTRWRDKDGRYRLPPNKQQEYLSRLETADSRRFRHLHERTLRLLSARQQAGNADFEAAWDAVFERLASRLYANDRAAFLALSDESADVPLQTAVAGQRRRFYQGGAHLVRDEYPQALAVFSELLTRPDLAPVIRARALNAQALIYRLTGKLEAARRGYQKSLELWQRLGDRYYEGMVLMNLGIVAYELRDYTAAETALRQAETLFSDIKASHWLAIVHNELGLVRRDLGQWDEALAYFQRSIAQRRHDGAGHHIGVGLQNRGEVLLFQGRLDEAVAALTEALSLMETKAYVVDAYLHLALAHQALGDLDEADAWLDKAAVTVESIDRREILPHVLYHIGDLRRQQGDPTAATAAWQRAAATIEETRGPLRDEAIKISLLGRWQQVYEALVLHFLAANDAAEAFAWAERARARAFAEATTPEMAARPSPANVASFTEIQTVLPDDTTLLCAFTTGVLEQDIPLLRAIPADNPLRQHLLLPSRTILFTITQNDITAHACEIDPNQFATASPRGYDATRFLKPAVLRRLRQSLLEPIGVALAQERLVIVPHGPLHRIPFAALLHEERPLASPAPIISYAPSGTVFRDSCLRAAATAAGKAAVVVGYSSQRQGRALQYTEAEVQIVADLMDGEAWTGAQPKKEALRETAATCRRLHIATHGWFDDADPLASYLETGAGERLTAREILDSWQLQADLVTLSACETGRNQILRGDEPMGLIRACLAAGAGAVLVSQWPVDDLATCLLMVQFYETLNREPADFGGALHKAQGWLRRLTVGRAQAMMQRLGIQPIPASWSTLAPETTPFADPQYWAGFILVGKNR